jgi:hypothetical protein
LTGALRPGEYEYGRSGADRARHMRYIRDPNAGQDRSLRAIMTIPNASPALRMAATLMAIGCTCLAPARADVLTLVMPATLASPDAMADPGIAFGALPDLERASRTAQDSFETAFNAALIENILTTTGSLVRMEPRVQMARPGTLRPEDLREAFTKPVKVMLPASPSVAQIANPTFGSPDGVAVSIAQKLVPTGEAAAGLNTDIRVRHSSDLVDAAFNLAGRQNFIAPDPMAVSYDGHALVAVRRCNSASPRAAIWARSTPLRWAAPRPPARCCMSIWGRTMCRCHPTWATISASIS